MLRFDLLRLLFGQWRSAHEAHVVNAIHLAVVLGALWFAREFQGAAGPTFDFIAMSAMATVVVFGVGRLSRIERQPQEPST